jgi:hypothetical protein
MFLSFDELFVLFGLGDFKKSGRPKFADAPLAQNGWLSFLAGGCGEGWVREIGQNLLRLVALVAVNHVLVGW